MINTNTINTVLQRWPIVVKFPLGDIPQMSVPSSAPAIAFMRVTHPMSAKSRIGCMFGLKSRNEVKIAAATCNYDILASKLFFLPPPALQRNQS